MRCVAMCISLVGIVLLFGLASAGDYPLGYVPGELLVCFTSEAGRDVAVGYSDGHVVVGIPSVDELNKKHGIYEGKKLIWWDDNMNENAKKYGLDRMYCFDLPEDSDIRAVVAEYEIDANVEWATPNDVCRVDIEPNDPRFPNQWALRTIQAAQGWDISRGDSSAVTGFIDSAVEWTHDDLKYGFWINSAEDINGNGVFDTLPTGNGGDLNFYDDDGNGFDDDVIGWDFVGWDNDPRPDGVEGSQHGTNTYGIANAVTDNGIGVSGLAWDCRGIAFRCGSGGSIFTNQAVQAMYYAVAEGACVISNSWGGYTFTPSVNAAIQYAYSQDVVIVASAGNDGTQSLHYPCAYDNVMCVAATDASDHRSSYSNYGDQVDVCAPGDNILTTTWNNGYESSYGTSVSSPFVTGMVALLKGMHPGWTNAQIESHIYSHCSCDSIDHLNPGYEGRLGWGRINVFRTLGTSVRSYVHIVGDVTVLDGGSGDGDGRPEMGERDSLVVWLKNEECWLNALSVQATLATSDTGIYLVDSTVVFPSLANGDSASNTAMPFVFDVSPAFDPHRVTFLVKINVSPTSYNVEDTVQLMIGHPDVLIVDDDGNGFYESFYENALDAVTVAWDEWDVFSQGYAGAALPDYCLVIWLTGDEADNTITAQDQTDLASYLDNGGLLFITGQNIGQDIGTDPFYSNYLHASFVQATTNDHILDGIAGDEIADGLHLLTAGSPGAGNQNSQDIIAPLAGADSIIMYGPGDCAAIKYDSGTYRVVYFGFGFEGIASRPEIGYDNNWHVIRRVINWLGCPDVGVEEETAVRPSHSGVRLFQNTPNPFSRFTTIRLVLGDRAGGEVRLGIYDAAGRLVKVLADGPCEPDVTVELDGSQFASGVYFLRLNTPNENICRKMVLTR